MPDKKLSKANPGRTFQVTQSAQQFGTWVHPQKFSEYEFIRVHSIPATDAAKSQIDESSYHDDLLRRAEVLGLAVEVPAAPPEDLTPATGSAPDKPNQAIRDSISDHITAKTVQAAGSDIDVRARNTDVNAESIQPVVIHDIAAAPVVADGPKSAPVVAVGPKSAPAGKAAPDAK